MSRTTLAPLLVVLLAFSLPAWAGQTPDATTKSDSGKSPGTTPPATTSSGVMQIKKQITGDFSYHFVSTTDKGAAAGTPPVPLPAPPGTDNVVVIPIPSSVSAKDGALEILDNTRGNVARLPISTKGVASLTESSFTLAQRVNVPIQYKGLGVVGVQATMTCPAKKYSQTRLLQPDDNGIARFDGVPLNEPVTVTISYGGNPPESQTKTLTATRPAEAWPPVAVTWADVKTVPSPAATAAASPDSAGRDTEPRRRAVDDESRPARQPESNPLNSLVSTVISLIFLAAVGYAVFWAYKSGRLKTLLDRLGINTEPVAVGAAMPDPFANQKRAPIQPITDGTADPLVGAALPGAVAAAPLADGPRLIATAGAYAGNIFPLTGASADIGRDTGNAVALPNDTNASRRHATIQRSDGQFMLVDNASSNGTFINGVRVVSQSPQLLRPGDEVQIGLTRFRFEA